MVQDLATQLAQVATCPQVVNGVELVLSQFCCFWCRACLEPVFLMVQGRGRVGTLQKEVRELKDLLEECHLYKKQLENVRSDPVLARVDGSEEGYDDDSGGYVPPSVSTPSRVRQLGSSYHVDDDSGGDATTSVSTPSCLRQFGSSFHMGDDSGASTAVSVSTPSCLRQCVSSFRVDDDSGGYAPHSVLSASCLGQRGSSFHGEVDVGGHAPTSVPTPSCLRQCGSSFHVDDDSGIYTPLLVSTPSCLRQLGSSVYADDDLQDVDYMVDNMAVMDKFGFEQICRQVEAASARRDSARRVSFAETVEVVEFEVMQGENNVGETKPQKHIVESFDPEELYVESLDQDLLDELRDAWLMEEFE